MRAIITLDVELILEWERRFIPVVEYLEKINLSLAPVRSYYVKVTDAA